MPAHKIFTDDFKDTPLWLDDLSDTPEPSTQTLPTSADVVIIGSGYTGLSAALQTARAGRHTVVVEAGHPGYGCSTRNGGQISTSIKTDVHKLARQFGLARAEAIRQEGATSLSWIEDFITAEKIDCDFERCGRFHAAHTPGHYEILARESEQLYRAETIESFAVDRQNQRSELGTDTYHGGVVFTQHAALHPAKYHAGLLQRAIESGVQIISQCEALGINRVASNGDWQFAIETSKGTITTRDALVATNGYTTSLTPWQRRRIIPVGSYVIATEPLPESTIDELFPTHRVASDTCKVVYYYRASPDRRRVVFGGRVSAGESDPLVSGPRLHADMCRIFPQLANTRISHSWMGKVAYSFDNLAHTGTHNGLHYAMSYCGSGVSMASYLGMRAGQRITGNPSGKTAFDNLPFPTRPFYTGTPWFLPAVVSWYRWQDKQQTHRASLRSRPG